MTNPIHCDDLYRLGNLTNDTIVADSISPESGQLARQGFAAHTGIVERSDFVVQVVEDAALPHFVKTS
jgi:hypothetical protein